MKTSFKFISLIAFLLLSGNCFAQEYALLKMKSDSYEKELQTIHSGHGGKRKRGVGNAMLSFYQDRISVLISADCIYSLSCSRFSREAINKKGLIAGVLLSADRLSRCTYLCSKDIPHFKFTSDGLARDEP